MESMSIFGESSEEDDDVIGQNWEDVTHAQSPKEDVHPEEVVLFWSSDEDLFENSPPGPEVLAEETITTDETQEHPENLVVVVNGMVW